MIDFDALEAAVTPRTRMLLYTSPPTPSGGSPRNPIRRSYSNLPDGMGCG